MLPFAYAGGHPFEIDKPSLLKAIANSNRPSLCDNATLRILVEYKWQTYGKNLFVKEIANYCLSLLYLMSLLLIRSDRLDALSLKYFTNGDSYQLATFVITMIVMIDSLLQLYREYRQLAQLKGKYFRNEWKNTFDLIVIILS